MTEVGQFIVKTQNSKYDIEREFSAVKTRLSLSRACKNVQNVSQKSRLQFTTTL